MYNSQYYTCEQIDQRLLQGYLDDYNSQNNTNLTKAEFLTLLFNTIGRNSTLDNLVTQIGYYECDTAGATAAKVITIANYNLFAGGSMKVKFANKNTANNATLNINGKGAKALYYQGERASANNSWDAEEVVEIYYDGTSYYANNVNGGSGSGVYDVSKEHPTSGPNSDGKFTLEYILNSSNVNELIPVNKRYPGMSIQFVSTSDNKYVQARFLLSGSFTNSQFTTISNWQIVFGGMGVLPTNTDINDVLQDGYYRVGGSSTFTYSNIPADCVRKHCLLCVYRTDSNVFQVLIKQENGCVYIRRNAANVWGDWSSIDNVQPIENSSNLISSGAVFAAISKFLPQKGSIEGISDLNDISDNGIYILLATTTYTNQPTSSNGQRILIHSGFGSTNADFKWQILFSNSGKQGFYTRTKTINGWSDWYCNTYTEDIQTTLGTIVPIVNSLNSEEPLNITKRAFDTSDLDLNNFKDSGYYVLVNSGNYTHCPTTNRRRILLVYKWHDNMTYQLLVSAIGGDMYIRVFTDGTTWSDWMPIKPLEPQKDLEVISYTDKQFTNTINNVGTKLKVMTYNVAHFNHDIGDYGIPSDIYNEKVINLKKMLMSETPDIIAFQEYGGWLDKAHTKTVEQYLLKPIWGNIFRIGGPAIASKFALRNTGTITFTSGRTAGFGYYDINNKVLLVYDAHLFPGTDATAKTNRESDLTELFADINEKTFDYCIVMGDLNITDDYAFITNICETNNFTMANGGYIGWLYTCLGAQDAKYPCDNILCSSNVVINSINSLTSQVDALYSDHVPLVAEVTLLD